MTNALDLDLKKLKARAFDRAEWAEGVVRRYHAATPKLDDADAQQLRPLYNWMFVPPTLWPFNVQDVLEDCLAALSSSSFTDRAQRVNASKSRLVFSARFLITLIHSQNESILRSSRFLQT
jgi:hypothetical protein